MRVARVIVVVLLLGGCVTKGSMKVGVGTGLGLMVVGGVSGIAHDDRPNAIISGPAVLAVSGASLLLFSLVTYGLTAGLDAMHASNERERARHAPHPAPPATAPSAPAPPRPTDPSVPAAHLDVPPKWMPPSSQPSD